MSQDRFQGRETLHPLIGTESNRQGQMNLGLEGPLPATLRQSPTQSPRRKAAVHSRWCALRATLARIGSASAGGGSSNRYLTRVSVSTTPAHLSSRTFSNACDPELDFPRPEIRCFMNARFFRRHSVFSTCTAARGRDQSTSLSSPLTFHLLTLPAPYYLAHSSDTTSISRL